MEKLESIRMQESTFRKLVWGWGRLYLGWVQMSLAGLGLVLLILTGPKPATLVIAGLATTATIVSRILYRGQKTPEEANKTR